jgi:hypothetical protein
MNEDEIRAELEAVKAALREDHPDIADLQARARRASSSLVVLLGEDWKPMASNQERGLRELIALWAEIKAALEARAAG